MAFVFYDTETTGLIKRFDQVLQFAAILTDDYLNVVDRFEIRSRVLPNIVPSPGAMRVNGVTAAQLDDPTLMSHYEMVCAIHEKLTSWEPAYFIGHNSIRFDEELLRSAFYRCLLPCYLTNTNGNARLDTLKIVQSAFLFESDNINFPVGDNGRASFKLDRLAPANGFSHENAHEAMADVEATAFMYRLLRERAPETWSRFLRFSNKSVVIEFTEMEEVFGFSDFYGGRPYTYMLHRVGVNPDDNKEIIAFDLRLDPENFVGLSAEELNQRMTLRPKPVRSFRANALPDLIEADGAHLISTAKNISFKEIEARAERLQSDNGFKQRIVDAFLETKTVYDVSPHVEERIYPGFPSNKDAALMKSFHSAEWEDCSAILNQIEDERYRELGEQLIFLEAPDCLPDTRQRHWQIKFAERALGAGESCDALTLQKAIEEAGDLIADETGASRSLLLAHRERLIRQIQETQSAAA